MTGAFYCGPRYRNGLGKFVRFQWKKGQNNHLQLYYLGDIAISSASFVLVSSDLRSLITLRDLSETVIKRVKFNFVSSRILYYLRHLLKRERVGHCRITS